MPVSVYQPSALVFATGNPISQIEQIQPDLNYEEQIVHPGQGIFPGFSGARRFDPMLDFRTTQIKDILDRCTVEGVCKDFSASNIDLEWQKSENLKTREAIGNLAHVKMRATHSMLQWESITATDNALAEIFARWQPISDGINPPVTRINGVAITAAPVQDVFELGPVVLNFGAGATTLCVDSWSWVNGLVPLKKPCSGGSYIEFASVNRATPRITVETQDVDYVLGLLPTGSALTSIDCYLRKLEAGKINVPNATAQHIKLSATVGSVKPARAEQIQIVVHSFTINTASAIP